ncbi:MAG: lysophospholipase [Gemmataceae bacterium]|nr:lysophospholipase [Gemmataceae bacterium]
MPNPMRSPLLLTLVLCSTVCGCASTRVQQVTVQSPPGPSRGTIYAVNGAGSFQGSSAALCKVVGEERLPYTVEVVPWSHGAGRFLADQMDYDHARAEGRQLAEKIAAYKQRNPCGQVFIVAHSAGSAVALSAAESLPPGSIDRIVLLAAAVSADYDLRPALRCCRCGIDNFYSDRDRYYLGIGAGIVGTTDREWTAPAGRVGFRPVIATADDECLYRKLHQHPWDSSQSWTGHTGGHTGSYRPEFMRAYVLPLFGPR